MTMRRTFRRLAAVLAAGAAPVLTPPATAQDSYAVDVSASAGIASNQFLGDGGSGVAASGTISVAPSYVWERDLTRFELAGAATLTEYSRSGYPTNDSYSLRALGQSRASERVTFNGEFSYSNSLVGGFNGFSVPINPDALVPVVPVVPVNGALAGLGRRLMTYTSAGGASIRLGEYDSLGLNVSAIASRYSGDSWFALDEFNSVGSSLSYTRTLDEGFDVSATVSVNKSDYLGTRLGDGTIIQPGIAASKRLDPSLTLSGSVGVAFSRLNEIVGTSNRRSINGAVSLCKRDERTSACANASRTTVPTGVLGVRNTTNLGISGGHQLSARDDVSLGINYTTSGAPLTRSLENAPDAATKFLSVSATYNRRFRPNLSGFVTGNVSKAFDDMDGGNAVFSQGRNYEVRIGASYHFGRSR